MNRIVRSLEENEAKEKKEDCQGGRVKYCLHGLRECYVGTFKYREPIPNQNRERIEIRELQRLALLASPEGPGSLNHHNDARIDTNRLEIHWPTSPPTHQPTRLGPLVPNLFHFSLW